MIWRRAILVDEETYARLRLLGEGLGLDVADTVDACSQVMGAVITVQGTEGARKIVQEAVWLIEGAPFVGLEFEN